MRFIGDKIYIRLLELSDAKAKLDMHLRNKEFFQDYTPSRGDEFYTLEYQINLIEGFVEESRNDTKYSFGIFLKETDELIGNVTLSEVLRGPLQSCYIGYYLDQGHNGRGYMTEAVKLTVAFGFKELGLHRIEAGVMPHNQRSMKVLEKAGFQKEGIARKNVKINGVWQDHQILAIISEEV